MGEDNRICGGIFCGLLLEAKKNTITQISLMKNLIRTFTHNPDFHFTDGLSKSAGEYKKCKINGNVNIPFNDTSSINRFNARYKDEKDALLKEMNSFIEKNIDPTKQEWLAKCLIETIYNDSTVSYDAAFYIDYEKTVNKKDLLDCKTIELSAFLTSVFHFVVTKQKDNTVGKDTFNRWYSNETEHSGYVFKNDKLGDTVNSITVIRQSDVTEESSSNSVEFPGFLSEPLQHKLDMIEYKKNNDKQFIDTFNNYYKRTREYYSKTKTLFYFETPVPFEDFYVRNDLSDGVWLIDWDNFDLSLMESSEDNFIITGAGGLGKSMMMRHLFYNITEYMHRSLNVRLPILCHLMNYSKDYDNLDSYLYDTVAKFDASIDFRTFKMYLDEGRFLLLLDGLDEISSDSLKTFEGAINDFGKRNPLTFIIISSRPNFNFINLNRFSILKIMPFTKKQATKMIDKLKYDKSIKESFKKELDSNLFKSHKDFAENPLLLTIMLMMYKDSMEIPNMRHLFYAKAFETMYHLHDGTKSGFKRSFRTGLEDNIDEFILYFSEFCAITYVNNKVEFNKFTFSKYMDKVIDNHSNDNDLNAVDFLYDLTDNICIFTKDGNNYNFIHRSFQEYFSAIYFSRLDEERLSGIGEFFETHNHMFDDKTFDIMYDLIPEKIDKCIMLPKLSALWDECDKGNGYWTFLEMMYPVIYAQSGTTAFVAENTPKSNMYNFMVNESLLRQNGKLFDIDWPGCIANCDKEIWVSVKYNRFGETTNIPLVVSRDDVNDEYIEEHGEPEETGICYYITVSDVLNDPDFTELKSYIESDDFPLKKEYLDMRSFTKEMQDRINANNMIDNIFKTR